MSGHEVCDLWWGCHRGDWLLCLATHNQVMPHIPDDPRVREALTVSRRYAVGDATDAELTDGRAAAAEEGDER